MFDSDSKLAIVVDSDLAFGLIRLYQSSREIHGVHGEIRVFRDPFAAMSWLAIQPSELPARWLAIVEKRVWKSVSERSDS